MTSKVSFTVRRPTPVSRATSSGPDSDSGSSFKVPSLPRHLVNDSAPGSPLARSNTSSPKSRHYEDDRDSSDEDDQIQDELVTGFDQFGVQRLHEPKKASQGPLVIPALRNRDWREMARKRRTASQFVPESARAQATGKDGSVGGLGTKDMINSGPVLSGLQVRKKEVSVKKEEDVEMMEVLVTEAEVKTEKVELTEDELALRALLAGNDGEDSGPHIDVILTPVSEADAYKQDVDELPESASLEDYSRVPISQFGAAMLRGMGWKEGTAASRKRTGMVEPYIPEARPALLGIGAKEMEVFDDGSSSKKKKHQIKEKYIPVIKKDKDGNVIEERRDKGRRDRSRSPRRESRPSSRRGSPDRDRDRYYDDRRRDSDRRRDRDYDRDRDSERKDRDRERDRRDRDRGKDKDRGKDGRRDKDRDY
ncbi:hypothetical protein D9758_008467 [Tetrapyrgos nigripes]|uniref:G-patch domain-containing protein n=1 Tax=Tetrapyrgos nigripes TaxID=182062 RepID=A0A8H5CNY9_9AGAR|nr:hypothetical protein D9758_008467 [Tetrapyrgos nigripes]